MPSPKRSGRRPVIAPILICVSKIPQLPNYLIPNPQPRSGCMSIAPDTDVSGATGLDGMAIQPRNGVEGDPPCRGM